MRKLAVLGASYLQKPIIEKANALGIETHCFARNNDLAVCKNVAHFFYPISVLEKEQILTKCQEISINGITTIATDLCVPTISYVAEKMNLISNSTISAEISTNKSKMRMAFEQGKVRSPKLICTNNINSINDLNISFPLIIKPTDRSGSRGVSKVYNIKALKDAVEIAKVISFEKKAVIEEFIEGVEVSVETISWEGKHYILAITDKITTGEPHFVELEHHQPSLLSKSIQDKIKTETIKALDSLKINYGASHSEFKITNKGEVFVIEVGARMGGDFIGSDLVFLSTGYDFVKGTIEAALGTFNVPVINKNKFSGVFFLSKETEKYLKFFQRQNEFDYKKAYNNSKLKNIKESNDRSGYLIYKSNKKVLL